MNGAREFASLFKTGQHGRLYLVSSSHARGKTFRIYDLPEGVGAKPNGDMNAPLNADAVEVYGVIGGQPGWTESYGWLYKGPWRDDFAKLVEARRPEIAELGCKHAQAADTKQRAEDARVAALLATYGGAA